jgi:heptosyltransferase II
MELITQSILIVHLGALGAVVRSTALLKPIREKYPNAFVTWITDKPADQLLKGHPEIDRVLTTEPSDLLFLSALKFDVGFVVDKSLKAAAILNSTQVEDVFGFRADPRTGAILPANQAAKELWEIGLDNNKKFYENKKTEIQLMLEALELGSNAQSDYNLPLSQAELSACSHRQFQWRLNLNQPIIGINTGCSPTIPYKKLTVDGTRKLISMLLSQGYENLVLLGGPEDSERNAQIGQGLSVIQSSTRLGLRDGLTSVAACDLVFTGDSLGMHMAISQKKIVLAWFGPTCGHEIEFYGRGEAVLTNAACSPCWKRTCEQAQMCYDQVDLNYVVSKLGAFAKVWSQRSSSIKQPSSEISF